MNYFDDERKIIDIFQDCRGLGTCYATFSFRAQRVCNAIIDRRKWRQWVYNARTSDPPPDFYSEKYGLMMEVMRVDDHAHVNDKGILVNPVNERESKVQKEIKENFKKNHPELNIDKLDIMVNAVTDLPSREDHNYLFYYENFKRTVEKHISKIPLYRQNHPDKKLIFFVFDESTAYLRVDDKELAQRGPIPLEKFWGVPQCFFADARFMEVFRGADIDFLIWFAPYKMIHGRKRQLPKIVVFDMKKYKFQPLIDYPLEYMVSSEA